MDNHNADSLESMISAYINSEYYENPPTEAQLYEAANKIRDNFKSISAVSDQEFETIMNHLKTTTVMIMDDGIMLPDLDNGHKPWIASRRADIDPFYWERYKKYLENTKHWNPRVTAKLGKVADDILDQCGNPEEPSFHIRGLVLGDVQSGKTANYTAIANKAADAGYQLIIVLSGIPEVLRQQTQKRLDAEMCGRQSNMYLDPTTTSTIKNKPVGVGRISNRKKVASFTSEANDFDTRVLKSNDLSLDNVNCPILLVVKKNKTILGNLVKWLKYNNLSDGRSQINLPMMLIDDEADNASVNTRNEDLDPTAINAAIRELLTLFKKTTYLAVTATPFANIFIDPDNNKDLFPSDFIYSLSAPRGYIGADRIFGDNGDKAGVYGENGNTDAMLVKIDDDKFLEVFPEKHKKNQQIDKLPSDMYEAAYYFLLTNAIRDIRGDNKEHRTMMVHVSRYVSVQNQVADILNEWLEQVKSDAHNYNRLPLEKSDQIESILALHKIWDKYNLTKISGVTWKTVLNRYLYRAIAPIDIRAVNGKGSAASLDYDNHKSDGLRLIAVGGTMLSRGLTLEGLCVTYFYRSSNMYDTLMQMGRWFGYRPNYEDLVKIWLSQSEIDWYGQITLATDDLKDQIQKMRDAGLKPSNFGLRVRQDPGSLIVTARNKMRTAKPIRVPISVSGHLLETPRLIASNEVLHQNESVMRSFVEQLASNGRRVAESDSRTHGNYFWEKVPADMVSNLLMNFQTHQWHLSYNGKGLADYVDKNTWKNGWDVVLIKKGEGESYTPGFVCGSETLSIPHTEERKIMVSNGVISVAGTKLRVGSGGIGRIGLDENVAKQIRDDYQIENPKKSIPDSEYLIKDRPPILMLHVIQADYEKEDDNKYPKFLFAIGVGFPDDESGTQTAYYQVNLVDLANWIDVTDDQEDDE